MAGLAPFSERDTVQQPSSANFWSGLGATTQRRSIWLSVLGAACSGLSVIFIALGGHAADGGVSCAVGGSGLRDGCLLKPGLQPASARPVSFLVSSGTVRSSSASALWARYSPDRTPPYSGEEEAADLESA